MYLFSLCLSHFIGKIVDVVMKAEQRIWDLGMMSGGVNIFVL